jgi:hypothetical protein
LDLAISLSNAISIEIVPSFQIAITGDSNNMYCFLACVNTTYGNLFQLDIYGILQRNFKTLIQGKEIFSPCYIDLSL